MNDTRVRLGNSLLKNLIGLRGKKGEILIEDVGEILQGMASTLQANSAPDNFLRSEIEKMAAYIVRAKSGIIAMVPDPEESAPQNINVATNELDEVVKAIEQATNTIMDAADTIQNLASGLGDAGAKIVDETMKIYDACSFQDITGQRINKVVRTLAQVEMRVTNLVKLFGGELPEGYTPPGMPVSKNERPDEALMNGPQLSKDMPNQGDIDALFDSIK